MRKHTTKTLTDTSSLEKDGERTLARQVQASVRKSQQTFVPSIVGRAYTFAIRRRFNDAVT